MHIRRDVTASLKATFRRLGQNVIDRELAGWQHKSALFSVIRDEQRGVGKVEMKTNRIRNAIAQHGDHMNDICVGGESVTVSGRVESIGRLLRRWARLGGRSSGVKYQPTEDSAVLHRSERDPFNRVDGRRKGPMKAGAKQRLLRLRPPACPGAI